MISKLFFTLFLLGIHFIGLAQLFTYTAQPNATTGKDAYINNAATTTNYGTATNILVSRASNVTIGFLEFDLRAIPINAIITKAEIVLRPAGSHSGTNASFIQRVTSSWSESTITWNVRPTSTTAGQVSIPQSGGSGTIYTVNVTAMVQDMVSFPNKNFGFQIAKQNLTVNGTLNFASSDNSNATLRPLIQIDYYIPFDVKAYVTPCTNSTTANGAINISVTNGVPTYSFSWSDGSTTKDIYNKLPGVYTLTVTGANSSKAVKQIIIGAENTSMTFTLQPNADIGKDAQIKNRADGAFVQDNFKSEVNLGSEKGSSGGWYSARGLLEFDLFSIPSSAVVNSANLILFGNNHITTRSNASFLYKNTQAWDANTVTWNNQPNHTTTDGRSIATTTVANQNHTINVTSHIQDWVNTPSNNFGWKLLLQDEATNNYAFLKYGSSDNTNAALRPMLIITVTYPVLTEAERNWQLEETYDENGQILSSQKIYFDGLGRNTQALAKNASGDVFASQTVYDAYGRPSINTLPAYVGNTLTYRTSFFLNTQAQEYNYLNFDVTGKYYSPDPVQTGLTNALGTYYSDLNTIDAWQATSNTPYQRTMYMANPFDEVKTVYQTDESFNAASNRQTRQYNMTCGDELKFILGAQNSYKVKLESINSPLSTQTTTLATSDFVRATKSVITSPDNIESITYSVGNKVIASCVSGHPSPYTCSMTAVRNYMDYSGTKSTDIHLPNSAKSSLSFPLPTYKVGPTTFTVGSSQILYSITDLNTETLLVANTDYTLNATTRQVTFSSAYLTANANKPLFLRISFDYEATFAQSFFTVLPHGIVQYNLDYGRWAVNYYDFAGNLKKSVSPKGINCSNPGTITMASVYAYSSLGELVAEQTPDEGLKEYTYDREGRLRFSQKAQQRAEGKFSYINYDKHGRPIEKGEYKEPNCGSTCLFFQNYFKNYTSSSGDTETLAIINETDGIDDSYCSDVTKLSYEITDPNEDVPTSYTHANDYKGYHKNGLLCKTTNNNATTWYKYDAASRLVSSVKQITDADFIAQAGSGDAQFKTNNIDYNDYYGTINTVDYQKESADELHTHTYFYNTNKQLDKIQFTPNGASTFEITKLSYDKLGRMVRNVLGGNLQGVDYVYTINGALKAINHPSLDEYKDRGLDGAGNNQVARDVFGEIIEYHPNDYKRTGSNIETNTNGLYDGLIYGIRYKTRDDVNGTSNGANFIDYLGAQVQLISSTNYTTQELANRYTYDHFGQLSTSTFGTFVNTTNSFTARNEFKEDLISYDANGNLTSLRRYAYNNGMGLEKLDELSFTISSNNNKHTAVLDNATNNYPSSFNYKNQNTGTPATFIYNANGEMTSSPDELVDSVYYYPNGQQKRVVTNGGDYITLYEYDDQGNKFKTTYIKNTGRSSVRYVYNIFGTQYEYNDNDGIFNLKEVTLGGAKRIGVYKQDADGLAISVGHAVYELTDHLGNVRVTFKNNAGNIQVLSRADYYAWGGQMPGRIWQQEDYRYGYQGQEKSQDQTTWDNFELRAYNHDLGRWSAPDPYAQFASPYLAMGNNPVTFVDPDGGYINMSSEGQSQRANFMNEQAYLRSLGWGRYSYDYLYPKYLEELERLGSKYLNGHNESVSNDKNHAAYVDELMKLNNDFAGLGLATNVMASGIDKVSSSFVTNNLEMMGKMTSYNGEVETIRNALSALPSWELTNFEKAHQAWLFAQDQKQRDRVNAWREKMWAEEEDEGEHGENEKKVKKTKGGKSFIGGLKTSRLGIILQSLLQGRTFGKNGTTSNGYISKRWDIIGNSKNNLVRHKGAQLGLNDVIITNIFGLAPDITSASSRYVVSIYNSSGDQLFKQEFSANRDDSSIPGLRNINVNVPLGSYILFEVYLAPVSSPWSGFDNCWNIFVTYDITK